MLFIQRDPATGAGTVSFDGDAARILKDGQVVIDWTSGGAITGVPQGDGYTLETRSGNTVTDQALAVGIVVSAMGQSNIAKWFFDPSGLDGGDAYQLLADGSWGAVSGTAAREFTTLLSEATGAPVGIINSALGSSSLQPLDGADTPYWLDGPDALYPQAVSAIDMAGGKAEFALWAQGEQDVDSDMPTYAATLSRLFGMVQDDFGAPSILIQEIGSYDLGEGPSTSYFAAIRQIEDDLADSAPDVSIGAVTTGADLLDAVHMDGASRALAAAEMAISAADKAGAGAAIARATASDSGDAIAGGAGIDFLQGGAGSDRLDGNGGEDIVSGGDGDDILTGGTGDDVLDGGLGADNVSGDDGNDVLGGHYGNDLLTGGAGNDELWGGHDDDTLIGGDGDDLLYGGAGNDIVDGGDGVDRLSGDGGNDHLTGDDGNDTITGGVGSSVLDGGAGDDYIFATGDDIIVGGSGNDVIQLTASPQSVDGGDGTDYLRLTKSMVFSGSIANIESIVVYNQMTVDFSPEVAGIRATAGSLAGGSATIIGGSGADTLIGGAGSDTLAGGDGKDNLTGGTGDTLQGDAGDDYITVTGTPLLVDGGAGTDKLNVTGTAVFGAGSLVGIETYQVANKASGDFSAIGAGLRISAASVAGGGAAVTGTAFADTLIGGAGGDTLHGGDGDDAISGGTGDTLDGDAGDDVIAINAAPAFIDGGDGTDRLNVTASMVLAADSIVNIETILIYNRVVADFSAFSTAVRATAASLAGGGSTTIGGTAADALMGGAGNDVLIGGAGADTLTGGGGTDTASYATATAGVVVDLADMSRNSGDAAGDSYAGIAAVGGSGYHDYLVGDAGANLLNGDAGADTLIGGAGADALTGGTGDDTYYVDDAGDNVVETSASGGNDIVYSSVSYDLHGRYVETLSLRGTGNIDATGNGQANTLIGNGGKNVLDGMAGNDTLTGGAGADTFVFDTAPSGTTNVDTITDFTIGQDLIQLDLSVFKKAGVAGGLGAGAFTIGSAATTTAQRIIYDAGTGDLFYDADGSGSGAQVQFATLAKNLALTAGSFSLHG